MSEYSFPARWRQSALRMRRASVAAVAVVLVVPGSASATVSVTPDSTAKLGAGGAVYGMAHDGGTTFIGGTFAAVGQQPRANAAAIGADGKVDANFNPSVNGKVMAVAVSADGETVYLGGTFTQAGGASRANLAAVDADTGQAVQSWQADTAGTAPNVTSLAVHGDRLYVGGRFTGIDGTTRKRLVAVNADGDVVPGFKPAPNKGVTEVVVSPDGSTVYAGGAFTMLSGQPRLAAGSVHATDGSATTFAPSGVGGNAVTIGLSPDGGRFFYGTENNTLFAYDPASSNDPVWSVKTSGNTQAIAVSGDEMWIGGHFSQMVSPEKVARPFIASLDPADGSVNAWDSQCYGGKMGVWALVFEGTHLHVGGLFSGFGTTTQRGYARFTEVV